MAAMKGEPEPTRAASGATVGDRRRSMTAVDVLVGCGWLSGASAADPRTRVESLSSSHLVTRVVRPDGQAAVVKQRSPAATPAGRRLRQELFVYRLARSMRAIADAVPVPIHIDEGRELVVLQGVPVAAPAASCVDDGAALERLAVLAARWHRDTEDTGLWPSPALGILELPDALEFAAAGRAAATQRLMANITADSQLAGALREARAGWQDRCLIHGDLRRENWIAWTEREQVQVTVVDWELSGSGDPAWDLAAALAEISLRSVRDGRANGSPWSAAQEDTAWRFLRAYVRHGGLLTGPETPDEWDHVLLCTIGRVLHVACEWSEMQTTSDEGPAAALLAEARTLYGRRAALVETWRRQVCA
jgi:hypothetical protein